MKAQLRWGGFINPHLYKSFQRGETLEGTAEEDGARVCGSVLPWVDAALPVGNPLKITSDLVAWEPVALEAEQARRKAEREAYWREHEAEQARKAHVAELAKIARWREFHRQFPDLPEGWEPAEVVSLRGLSSRSSGNGSHGRKGNAVHIHLDGRFICGYEPKFSVRVQGEEGHWNRADLDAPNCKGCLKRAGKFRRKEAA
jgi:hypothetical protein